MADAAAPTTIAVWTEPRLVGCTADSRDHIALPLIARHSLWRATRDLVVTALAGSLFTAVAWVMVVHVPTTATPWFGWLFYGFYLLPTLSIVVLFPAALVCVIADASDFGHTLTLDVDTLHDTRACPAPIAWAHVVAVAQSVSRGPLGVVITLRSPLGTASCTWRDRLRSWRHRLPPEQLFISALMLDVPPMRLVRCIEALAARHGARVEMPLQHQPVFAALVAIRRAVERLFAYRSR